MKGRAGREDWKPPKRARNNVDFDNITTKETIRKQETSKNKNNTTNEEQAATEEGQWEQGKMEDDTTCLSNPAKD